MAQRTPTIRFTGIAETAHCPGAAVVIGVLRAFTTAAHAFDNGAARILLAADDDDALRLLRAHPDSLGIRDTPPFDGYRFVNSPEQLEHADVAEATIVQRTVNGTVGVHAAAAAGAEPLLCGSLAVASATARRLLADGVDDVTFVVTGDNGAADEDLACAEFMSALLRGEHPDAAVHAERVRRSRAADSLRRGLADGYTGIRPRDIELAAQVDRFDVALVVHERDGNLEMTADSLSG